MMKRTLLAVSIMTLCSVTTYAKGSLGSVHLNYGLTLFVVALIAAYSAKLVADKQKQTKNQE